MRRPGNPDAEIAALDRCAGAIKFPKFWDGSPRFAKGSCGSGGRDATIGADPSEHVTVQDIRPFAYASGDFWLMARRVWHAVGGYIEGGVLGGRGMATWGLDGFSLCRALGAARAPQTTFDGRCHTVSTPCQRDLHQSKTSTE